MTFRNVLRAHLLLALAVWCGWWWLGGDRAVAAVSSHWQVTLTMVFGSFIAGATSEGGGAVAFPVFTKALEIRPEDAKIFSLAIQSVGMTAASAIIFLLRVKIERWALIWAGLGGIPGVLFGTAVLAPLLSAPLVRLSFTIMVSAFAITLITLNRGLRTVNEQIPVRGPTERALLLAIGFLGGLMSGLVGNGIDILTFSLLVLLFRISEKVATPTSVVLMAFNALVGFAWHALVAGDFSPQIQDWWLAAIPVVVIGAPAGAMLCARMDRKTIANVLILLIGVELMTSLWLIPMNLTLAWSGLGILLLFSTFFLFMLQVRRYEASRP